MSDKEQRTNSKGSQQSSNNPPTHELMDSPPPHGYGTLNRDDEILSQRSNDQVSIVSKTDQFPKTNMTQTIINFVKCYIGLGILAGPSGYQMTGFILATVIILVNGMLNTYTMHCQTRAKEHYGKRVKSFIELARASYGQWGEVIMALVIIINQLMCCTGYLIFFYEEIELVLYNVFGIQSYQLEIALYIFSMLLLIPLSVFFESLKQVSYISAVALISIVVSLIYVLWTDFELIINPTYDRTYSWVDFQGIPYFFGISLFMFEGNTMSIEIYRQMQDAPTKFNNALVTSLQITAAMIVIVGSISYAAYGQYTNTVILLNLTPGPITYLIQLFYSVGIIISYCIQSIPVFVVLKSLPCYQRIPENIWFPSLKFFLTRAITAVFCCTLAFIVPNLSSFLNIQGAVTGTIITFIFPLLSFMKTLGKEVTKQEKIICWSIIAYGTIGGTIAFVYSVAGFF